jgi:hypothetical protein
LKTLTVSLIALAAWLGAVPLHADESASDKAAADALFKDARKLMTAGSVDDACPKFAESHRLSPRAGTLLNLAICHEKQGKTASAWAEYNEVVALAKRDKRKDREEFARTHAKELEPKLARIRFEMSAKEPNLELALDGKRIDAAVWVTALPIDPGPHRVEVSAPGKKPWNTELQIKAGSGTTSVDVPRLESETAAPSGASSSNAPETSEAHEASHDETPARRNVATGTSPLAWVALGVGVAGVAVGSYFGLRTFSKKSDADDHCGSAIGEKDANACDQRGVDLRDQAKTSGTFSTVGFAVGAAGIGLGVILLVSGGSTHEAATWVAPSANPHGGGVAIGGRL